MTTDGKPNIYGNVVLDVEQVERIKAGDSATCWAFVEQNHRFFYCWARKFISTHAERFRNYEIAEFVGQIFVDCQYYKYDDAKSIRCSIYHSFQLIEAGGYLAKGSIRGEIILDSPLRTYSRSGEMQDGVTIGEMIVSREPTPDIIIEAQEHIEEIAPRFYREIKREIYRHEDTNEATIGELLRFQKGFEQSRSERFQNIIEDVFFGLTFEEVQEYAKNSA